MRRLARRGENCVLVEMLRTDSYLRWRRLGATGVLVVYLLGISQMLPAMVEGSGVEGSDGTAQSGCPTVTSCAMTAAYGPCCCLTSTAPADIGIPGLMAVGCALPDDYSTGTVGLTTHTTASMSELAGPLTAIVGVGHRTFTASSVLLLPADEVPRLFV